MTRPCMTCGVQTDHLLCATCERALEYETATGRWVDEPDFYDPREDWWDR